MNAIVRLNEISIAFGGETIYDRLSFDIRDGEFICIVGRSGCGKSTLLRVIADLLAVDSGEVTIGGRPAKQAWQEIAFVFQSPRLLAWRSAEDNVVLGQQLRFGPSVDRQTMHCKARELLGLVGLGGDGHKMPAMLSGGEKQRVSIARALAVDPKIILMDEPFSALDIKTRHHMRSELVEIWKKTGKTIVFVTHEIEEAIELADRIVVLSSKPTTVRQVMQLKTERPRDLDTPELKVVRAELQTLLNAP
ncbi:NitT/TauT family transport system ATP-binding protein [Xaviernesmea oryzae]|uniref:NitT/TauT family transport system ATP-binding protein n=1 Tax=Xaviernesmea oryzae TaxID=464029 RepID=A0A1X7G2X8_9HYPH|nr:ABC transporter ATP-binding protein [Xaviernesmea oryzae]SMF62494.1 NitT/TauT family transport system ATP-binding protein [Xaviernesmea oryzae]